MPCRFVCTTHTPYCMYCKRASSFYYSSGTSVFTVCHRRRHHRHHRTYPLGRAISHEHHLPVSALEGVVCVQILELQHVILERRFRYDKKSSCVIVVRRAYLFGSTTRSRIDVYTRNDSFARLRLLVEVLRYLEEMMRERYCVSIRHQELPRVWVSAPPFNAAQGRRGELRVVNQIVLPQNSETQSCPLACSR